MKAVVVLLALAAAGAAAAAGTTLDAAALRPAQVGAGYTISGRSRGLAYPTLDLCFRAFPSEGRRLERLQVVYKHRGVEDVSNEIVRYRAGGAQQALREVAVATCTNKKKTSGSTSETMTARRVSAKGAPAGAVALEVEVIVVQGGKRKVARGAGVYIARGDTLSGVYTYGPQAAALARAVRLSKVSLANLAHA